MRHKYYLADVFTDRMFGGNQLAVFTDADAIPAALMQSIAAELNLSETVFLFAPDDASHTVRMRIFTPRSELPFAGHPTIGTACVLAATGRIKLVSGEARLIFEEGVGPIPVVVRDVDNRYFAQFTVAMRPEFGPTTPTARTLAELLSISADELHSSHAPAAVSAGVPFLLIPVRDRDVLARVRLDLRVWEKALATFWAPHVYVFTPVGRSDSGAIAARMFAPALGISEDPATGGAAAALAGYLGAMEKGKTRRWLVEQGTDMGRPSTIQIEADVERGSVSAIRVAGTTVLVGEGELELQHA